MTFGLRASGGEISVQCHCLIQDNNLNNNNKKESKDYVNICEADISIVPIQFMLQALVLLSPH